MLNDKKKDISITFLPRGLEVTAKAGERLVTAARRAGVEIETPCGGHGTCGGCAIRVAEGDHAPGACDRAVFDNRELAEGLRLCCQIELKNDLVVDLAPQREGDSLQILTHGLGREAKLDPLLKKIELNPPQPSLEDQRADWERVKDAVKDKLGIEPRPPDIKFLRKLPRILREGRGPISMFLHGNRILDMVRNGGKGPYGIALDVGTTTIVGYLLDLQEGKELAVASTLNLQSEFGHDVMSRITYAQMNDDGLETLHARGMASINKVIDELAHKAGVGPSDIYHLTVVGNTCMHHFLLQLDPSNIGLSPYVPVLSGPHIEVAGRLGLGVNPAAMVDFLPNIAGFVGADTVAVLLTTMIQESPEICIALDIGTNGEIAMGSREIVMTCSTAAGPAFEGAKIRYGMRASSGAIHRIQVEDRALLCETINGEPPRGICGSGLIDAAALLLNHGLMDETGRILTMDQVKGEDLNFLKKRLYENNGSRGFILTYANESSTGEPVLLTQEDIRELQLAKGAIFAGIRILEKELAVSDEQIHKVYLAGAFGSFLNPASAMRIGLIPPMPLKKVVSIGNAAGHGAQLAMLSAREMEKASELAASVGYLELSTREDFQDQFISAINFPAQM